MSLLEVLQGLRKTSTMCKSRYSESLIYRKSKVAEAWKKPPMPAKPDAVMAEAEREVKEPSARSTIRKVDQAFSGAKPLAVSQVPNLGRI